MNEAVCHDEAVIEKFGMLLVVNALGSVLKVQENIS